MSYTVFEYVYRDAANFKVFGEAWLSGILTAAEKERILYFCDSSEFFVATQIGVDDLLSKMTTDGELLSINDHGWHGVIGFRTEDNLPNENIIWGTAEYFLNKFVETDGNWKVS